MVGDLEKSSFSNIEQQSLEFVKYTLDPWVIRWEQTIHRSLSGVREIHAGPLGDPLGADHSPVAPPAG